MAILKKYWLLIAVPIVVFLAVLVAVRIVGAMDYHHNDNDFFTFWLAGHLVTRGGNPYDSVQWIAGYHQFDIGYIPSHPIFLYPLTLALFMAPLGILPFYNAYLAWVTVTQLMIFASLYILISLETNPRAKFFFIPLLGGIVLFRPTLLTLIQGQVGGFFLLVLVWVTYLWHKGKWFSGGLLLGFLTLKPNLGLVILPLLTIWLLFQKQWRAIIGTLISGIVILFAGLLYNSSWIIQYWHVGNNKLTETIGRYPTIWELGALIGHNNPTARLIIGGATALLVLLGFFWTILRSQADRRPLSVLALTVTVTLLVTPYSWTYDQLLLILPITMVVLAMDRRRVWFPLTSALFLGIDILFVFVLFFDTILQGEILNVVITMLVFGLCLLYLKPRLPANT
jgi:arabinofuranan 3-O-arabinosyltransferase